MANSPNSSSSSPFSLTDPNDFPESWKALRSFDGALRCPVCGDFYSGPMGLPCGHQFCSFCIRNLFAKGVEECPQCRVRATTVQLKPIRVLDEICGLFKTLRPRLVELTRTHVDQDTKDPNTTDLKTLSKGSFDVKAFEPPSTKAVECPLCQKQVFFKALNQHIDTNCSDKGTVAGAELHSQMPTISEKQNVPKYMPSTAYFLLSEKELRRMLKDAGLSTSGSFSAMQKRHQQFVLLYNANQDRADSKPISSIISQVAKWEKNLDNASANKSGNLAFFFGNGNSSSKSNGKDGPILLDAEESCDDFESSKTSLRNEKEKEPLEIVFKGPGNIKEPQMLTEIEASSKAYLQNKEDEFFKLIEQVRLRKKQKR